MKSFKPHMAPSAGKLPKIGKLPKVKTPKVAMPAQVPSMPQPQAQPPAFKHGGKVKKTGMAKVHKGERVLTEAQARKMSTDELHKRLGGKDY